MLPRNGFIMQSDGSAYNSVIPADVTEAITEDYIPLDFAKSQIQTVVDDFKTSNTNYEKYIEELKDHHTLALRTYREHYEEIITGMKTKAKDHIGLLKDRKKASDESHQLQISDQEIVIEDLRDLLAHAKNDKRATDNKIDLLETKVECTKAIYSMVLCIEQDHLSASLVEEHRMTMEQEVANSVKLAVNKTKKDDYEQTKSTIEPLIKQLKDQLAQERTKVKELSAELEDAVDELEDLYDDLEKDGYKIKFDGDDGDSDSEENNSDADTIGSIRSKNKGRRRASIISPKGRKTSVAALKRAPSMLQDIKEQNDEEENKVEVSVKKEEPAATTNVKEMEAELREMQERCADLQTKLEQSDKKVEDLKFEMLDMQQSSGLNPMPEAATNSMGANESETTADGVKNKIKDEGINPMSAMALAGLTKSNTHAHAQAKDEVVNEELYQVNNDLQRKVQELEQLLEETRSQMLEQEQNLRAQLQQQSFTPIDQLKKQIADKSKELLDAEVSFQSSTRTRKYVKETISTWISDFQAENGREPTKEDKESIKDRFKQLKVETAAVATTKDHVDRLKEELAELNSRLQNFDSTVQVPSDTTMPAVNDITTDAPTTPIVAKDDKESQTDPVAEPAQTVETSQADEVDAVDENKQKIVELEEALQKQQQVITEIQEELEKKEKIIIDVEEAFTEKQEELKGIQAQEGALEELREQHGVEISALREQIDNLIAQKRTDVVKRLTDENNTMTEQLSANALLIAELQSGFDKNKAKIQELTDRAFAAEAAMKVHEETDKAASAEEAQDKLKAQIKKQRQEIMSKTAAATSGWNAAADADEKLTIEVEKAYKRGCDEMRQKLETDSSELHAGIEEKEDKITELLLDVANTQKEKRALEEAMTKMQSDIDDLRLYLSDMEDERRAASEAGDDAAATASGGGVGIGHMQADLDKAMEQLDESHEELVELKEKLELNQQLLEIANEKVAAYNRAISGKSGKAAENDNTLSKEDKEYCMQLITKSIKDGTLLWKQSKKEQCYDLYLDTCKHIEKRVAHEESLKKIITPAIASSAIPEKVSHTIAGLKKSKAAVSLRSALEQFVVAMKGSGGGGGQGGGLTPVVLASLKKELVGLKEKELDIGVHIEEEEEEKEVLIIGEDAYEDHPADGVGQVVEEKTKPPLENAAASSLLKRAKAAENEVHELRMKLKDAMAKQFANINILPISNSTKGEKKEVTVTSKRAEEIQIRRLTRQVEQLEVQLKGARRGAGGGFNRPGASQGKANPQVEREFKKQIKEMEAATKKEKLAFEKQLREKDKAYKELQKEKQDNEGDQAEMFEKAKLAKLLQEEVNELREKADELVTTTKELEALQETHAMVNEQLKKESGLRKKYKNELEDLKGNIRVYARCRPFAQYEKERHCEKVVSFVEETGIKVQTSRGEKEYEFDQVFNMESSQEAVFEDTRRLVESFLDGFNVCLFAYGQTGSGKTHTMTGNSSMPGLTPRAIDEMFKLMGEKHHCQFKITSSFMELYNNQLVDLFWILDHHKSKEKPPALEIRQDSKGIIFVQGAVIKDIESSEDLMTLFNTGNKERHVGATKMNAESSRSHSVFCIMVESFDTSTKKTTLGKLSLVDLAGSERADKTGASGDRLQEAKAINQSLSALGNVISALTEGRKPPYKDNTLTKLMQDSLGGNAKTLMFVNFSPADYNSDETVSSLNYAARVKKIVNSGAKQEENEEMTRLKSQVKSLQAKLKGEDTDGHLEAVTEGGGRSVV